MTTAQSLKVLSEKIIHCRLCPRLVHFRETVPIRASFNDDNPWRKPVPGFGDPHAWLMITGLAPSANGANRTGRMFTGDPSARFLYNALYKTGFANQPTSEFIGDGLKLIGCFLTAAVKCVPPDNTPTKQEFLNCSQYYHQELTLLKDVKCILVLGKHAFDSYKNFLKLNKVDTKQWTFSHGAHYTAEHFPAVYASYHPSPQNTNTGKMTEKMFLDLLETIKRIRGEPANS